MSDVKWIKITTDIFDPDSKLFSVESMKDGYLLELVWFKLLVLTGKLNNNGMLVNSVKIPYTDEMLSQAFRIDLGTIQRAIDIFEELKMIEVIDNAYMISNWLEYQNGEKLEELKEKNKVRQARYREKQKQQTFEIEDKADSNVTSNVTNNVINNVTPSISYSSSKSNFLNFNSLIDSEEYLPIKNNIELRSVIEDWMDYKDAKGKQHLHYAEKSMRTLLNTFIDNNNKYGTSALRNVVDFTIGQGYQGIVWDKLQAKREVNAGANVNKSDWLKMWENA